MGRALDWNPSALGNGPTSQPPQSRRPLTLAYGPHTHPAGGSRSHAPWRAGTPGGRVGPPAGHGERGVGEGGGMGGARHGTEPPVVTDLTLPHPLVSDELL